MRRRVLISVVMAGGAAALAGLYGHAWMQKSALVAQELSEVAPTSYAASQAGRVWTTPVLANADQGTRAAIHATKTPDGAGERARETVSDEASGAELGTDASKTALQSPTSITDAESAPEQPKPVSIDLTLQRAAGELVMVGFHGFGPQDAGVQRVLSAIRTGKVGGVIVMDRNIRSLAQTKRLVAALTAATPKGALPLLISVDQEGGAVQRIDAPGRRRRFPSAWRLARTGDIDRVRSTYRTMSQQLAALGFNLNFGPVVDLRLNPRNPIIARKNRSFGNDPEKVAGYARVFIDAHHREGVATTLKHFPGHGSSWGDTHHGFVNITRPFRDVELAPYAQLMATGHADAIMIGHLAHAAFGTKSETDLRPMPATLSRVAIQRVLRGELGFQGVVITDDLAMGAIKRYFDFARTTQKALVAGNDILLMTSGPRGMLDVGSAMHREVLAAVRDGAVTRDSVLTSARRVRQLKASIAGWMREASSRRARERAARQEALARDAERGVDNGPDPSEVNAAGRPAATTPSVPGLKGPVE